MLHSPAEEALRIILAGLMPLSKNAHNSRTASYILDTFTFFKLAAKMTKKSSIVLLLCIFESTIVLVATIKQPQNV